MDIEVTQLVGNILPSAKIGRIILESKTKAENVIDDPHIESDLENKITYSNGTNNDTLSKMVVSLDIILKDLPQKNNASSWSTNPDFNRFLKCRVIQCRDRDLSVVLANNLNSNNAESGKINFLNNVAAGMEDQTIYWTDVHTIDLKQGAPSQSNEYVNSRFLAKTPKTTTNGKTYFEYVYRVEFSVATDKPGHVSYFAHTYIDVCQMNEELDTDLPCFPKTLLSSAGVAQDVMTAAFGDITQSHVIKNGLVRKTNLIFMTENQEVWSGPAYYLGNKSWSGTPEGTPDFDANGNALAIPLTAITIPNTKVIDYRAKSKMLKFPLDATFINQAFYAPFEKMKAVGSTISEVWGELGDPAYFSDMYISRGHKEAVDLVFSVDMSALFYYNSKYAAFTKSPIGNPIDQMIDATRIKNIKVYRKQLDSSGDPQLDEELIAESNSDVAPGSSLTFFAPVTVEDFSKDNPNPDPMAIGIEVPTYLKGNNYIRTFKIRDNIKSKMSQNSYQYRIELEFSDGGRDFLLSLLDTLNSGLQSLERYYNAADVPGNFDHDTYRFKEDFATNQKEPYIKEIIPTLATIDWMLKILPSSPPSVIPGGSSGSNLSDVGNVLYSFSNPQTGDISGIAAVRDIAAELVAVMSKFLGQAYSKTDKNSAYAQNKATPSTKDIKNTTQIKHNFSDTYRHRPYLGYTFAGLFGGSQTYTVGQEEQMGLLKNLDNVFPADKLLDIFQKQTNNLFVLDDGTNTPSGIIDIENDGTYQNISFEGTKFSYLTPVALTIPSSNAGVPGGTEVPTTDIQSFTDQMVGGSTGVYAEALYNQMAGLIIDNITAGDPTKQDGLPVEKKFENFLADMGCTVEYAKVITEKVANPIKTIIDLPQGEEDATDGTDGSFADNGFGQSAIMEKLKFEKGLINLIVTDDSWSDRFENSLDRYNLLKAGNAFSAFIDQPDKTDDFRIKLFNSLPNQIKSLFIGSRAEVDQVSYVKFNPYKSLEGIDPFIDPAMAISFFMNFVNIVEVQVLDSYLTSEILGGKQKRNYVSSPNWVRLTKNVMSQRTGERVLCRLVQWKDSVFGTDFKDKFYKLPIYNEYFYMDMPGPPVTQASPPPPYPSIQVDLLGEMANNMLGDMMPAELPEALEVDIYEELPNIGPTPGEPSAGGGYF